MRVRINLCEGKEERMEGERRWSNAYIESKKESQGERRREEEEGRRGVLIASRTGSKQMNY